MHYILSLGKAVNSLQDTSSIGVLATDTIYGVVARALDEQAVARLYKLKGRTPTKPFIILISDISQVSLFGVEIDDMLEIALKKYWPGPVSIILPTSRKDLAYLHRGQNSLAFRLPAKKELTDLIAQTGPLVAPSANPEGVAPAETINQAKAYFGDSVDFYIDSGKVVGKPSKIIKIIGGQIQIIRD